MDRREFIRKATTTAAAAAVVMTAASAQAVEVKQYVSLKGNYAKVQNTWKEDDGKMKFKDGAFGGSLA